MSRINNVDTLEKQLAGLHMNIGSTKGKKTPPAVPPKKRAQPQVPHSTELNDSLHQPSYSTRISPNNNFRNYASYTSPLTHTHKDYANMNVSTTKLPANYNTYSNVSYNYGEDLPPPPPPPPINIDDSKYDMSRNIDDYLPAPPSPVSSNYSELARATMNMNYNHNSQGYPHIYQNDYPLYGPSSSAANYESIYEPVDPRPQSRNSNESVRNISKNLNANPLPVRKSPLPKEAEVDALTEMLVKSISDSTEYDVFGVCIKCNGKVVGEASGCTAMDNMYHVQCFTCHRCGINLQGKPFYAVDGNPYCEPDYFETLEKCSVCMKPVLDRILRATGKPYHPACFICVVCGKSLDGIPFTVDAMNQIHCIEDFHKKFAPRCCVCELPIMPEKGEEETVRVVALDRSFHVRCYRCEDCGLLLSSEAQGRGCYPLDNHILCKSCNAHRIRLLTNVMTTDL